MKKRILCILLAAIMMLATLAGCSGDSDGVGSTPAPANTGDSSSSGDTESGSPDNPYAGGPYEEHFDISMLLQSYG